jgi:hypothetical protein
MDKPADNHFPIVSTGTDFGVAKAGRDVQKLPAELLNLSETVAMNLRTFISASAVVLIGWLALSFQHRGIPSHYPKPNQAKAAVSSATDAAKSLVSAISPSP